MKTPIKVWIVGICIGLCLPALYFLGQGSRYSSSDIHVAKTLGEDVESMVQARDLHDKVLTSHTMSQSEIEQAKRLMTHKNPDVRLRVVMCLKDCTDPAAQPGAVSLLEQSTLDTDGSVRYKALKGLSRQKDPQIKKYAEKLTQDSDPEVREVSKAILTGQPVE